MSMTRKQLVVRGGAVALWATAGAAFVAERMGAFDTPPKFDRADFAKPGRSAVAVLGAATYDGDLEGVVLDGLRLVRADVRGKRVLLKPNLVEFVKGSSINTDPRMVVATANAIRRLGASSVVVAEGPGHRRDVEAIAFASGLREALDDAGLRFVDLNDAPLVRTPLETRYTGLDELWVPRILRETEVVVSMPKLKTHHWVGVTMSLKNCFGCMPGRVYGWPKDVFHVRGIPESILDIAATVRPSLAIIDGIVGMQGDGPIMGDPVHSGVGRRLARSRRRGRHRRAPDGHGSREGRVPDGSGPLPRPVALGADRAARRGPGASGEAVPAGAAIRVPRRVTTAVTPSGGSRGG